MSILYISVYYGELNAKFWTGIFIICMYTIINCAIMSMSTVYDPKPINTEEAHPEDGQYWGVDETVGLPFFDNFAYVCHKRVWAFRSLEGYQGRSERVSVAVLDVAELRHAGLLESLQSRERLSLAYRAVPHRQGEVVEVRRVGAVGPWSTRILLRDIIPADRRAEEFRLKVFRSRFALSRSNNAAKRAFVSGACFGSCP